MSLAEITDCQDWAARAPGGLRLWHVDLDAHARDVPLDGLSAAEHARLRDRADAQGVSLEEALRRLI